MKRYLPLIAILMLSQAVLIIPSITSKTTTEAELDIATELRAMEIAPELPELKEYAQSLSVKITSNSQGGSGVIIGKQNDQYLVITNNHVVREAENLTIQTADGTSHPAALRRPPIAPARAGRHALRRPTRHAALAPARAAAGPRRRQGDGRRSGRSCGSGSTTRACRAPRVASLLAPSRERAFPIP